MMRNLLQLFFLLTIACNVNAQIVTRTITATGNWNVATTWSGSNIGDDINEDVLLNSNINTTVVSGSNYTIRNLTGTGDNSLTIQSSASLTLGASGTPATFKMNGNNPKVTVGGTLTIWGNATFVNKAAWNITGTVIIKGNLELPAGANLTLSAGAKLIIEGSLIGGGGTDVNNNGTISVYQNINVTAGNPNGSGTFQYGGTCTSPSSNFCNNLTRNGALPVTLSALEVTYKDGQAIVVWQTETERNSYQFIIERSVNGVYYEPLGEQEAAIHSVTRQYYQFIDRSPVRGLSYYRLKAIDLDGSFEYFGPKSLRITAPKSLSVYPNPVEGKTLSFRTNFAPSEADRIMLINYLGVELLEININDAANSILLHEDFQQGPYILRYISDDFETSVRVLIK